MDDFWEIYSQFYYHRFEIRMIATENVVFDAWTGAVIRNNLLYAADNVRIDNANQSLRECIDTFPLNETHPLYKELKDGFPKGYVLTDFSHFDLQSSSVSINKNEIFSFSLVLIGDFSEYKSYFFQAIRLMCERGIGKPLTPFILLDIAEQSLSGESQIMAVAQTDLSEKLQYPVRLADFIPDNEPDEFSEIVVRHITPVILFRLRSKKNTQLSYQDKCNRFPSFYQLVRSAFFRLQKLYAVYMSGDEYNPATFDSELIDACLEQAGYPLLQSVNMQYITLQNTQKKGKINEMPLAGYVGEQVYSGYFRKYLALLRFMEKTGAGNETVYGMGKYEVANGEESRKERQSFKKVSTLIVRFKNEIEYSETSEFRKEIMNILTETKRSHRYSYPLIQCKRLNGKASIICIEEGTEHIGEFFSNLRNASHLNDKETSLELDTVNAYKVLVQTWKGAFTYSIRKWHPFNKMNYEKFRQMNDKETEIAFLEELLIDNILFFAKGTGVRFEQKPTCSIINMEAKEPIKHESVNFAAFDLLFKTNVSLPNYIGLGKGVSYGFGTVVRMNNNENKI
jgi:hypothetical protein